MKDKRFITAREVAGLFEVSPSTVLRWAKDGRLPALVTPSGRLRFPRESIQKMIKVSMPRERVVEGGTQ